MKDHYDIIIVGGGLVGYSLAYALRHFPITIALIEANSSAATTSLTKTHAIPLDTRAIALSLGSSHILSQLGLWQDIRAYAETIRTIHVSDKGHFGFTRLNAAEVNATGFGYVIDINHLNQSLWQACQKCHNLTLICPANITELSTSEHNTKVVLTIENEVQQIITAQLLIAADGINSTIRQLQQIPSQILDYQQTAIATTLQLSRDHQQIAYERFTSNGPLALLPLPNRYAAVVWTVPHHEAKSLLDCSDETFLSQLQQCFGYRLGRFNQVGKRMSYPLQLLQTDQSHAHRVLLIGNAAHTLHPVAGQGFNLSLGDIATLTKLIEQTLTEKNNTRLGDQSFIATYQQLRRWPQRLITVLTHGLVKSFSTDFPLLNNLRSFGMVFMDRCPPLKRQFTRYLMGTEMEGVIADD